LHIIKSNLPIAFRSDFLWNDISLGEPLKDFKQRILVEEIYQKYDMTEENLIFYFQRKIKGKYDYRRIFRGGERAQTQFLKHLFNRWNPLKPDDSWDSYSPYVAEKTLEKE